MTAIQTGIQELFEDIDEPLDMRLVRTDVAEVIYKRLEEAETLWKLNTIFICMDT